MHPVKLLKFLGWRTVEDEEINKRVRKQKARSGGALSQNEKKGLLKGCSAFIYTLGKLMSRDTPLPVCLDCLGLWIFLELEHLVYWLTEPFRAVCFWDQLCSSPARVIISNFSHYPRFCPFLYLKTDRFNLLIGKSRDQRVEANKWKFIHNLHMLMQLQNFNFILLVFCFYCSKSYHLRHLLLNIWYCINCLYLALIMIIFCIFILIYLNRFSTTEY